MKKTILVLVASTVVITVVILIFKNKVGDIRPSVFPSSNSVQLEQLEQSGHSDDLSESVIGNRVKEDLKLAAGFEIGLFASGLGKARNLEVSPGGVVLVSNMESIIALPDKNRDGLADEQKKIVQNLDRTHGFAFYGSRVYVTEESAVTSYLWDEADLTLTDAKKLFDLPKGGRHFTRSIVFAKDGTMYISLGSTCNVCDEKDPFFASVIISDSQGSPPVLFARGLRNSVALAINPVSQILWGAENGRDMIGDNIPPEEVNIIRQDADYGWPNCYADKLADSNFKSSVSKDCGRTVSPIWGMQAHTAPLGMEFIPKSFNPDWEGDLLVAQHGSWNRSVPSGYKVVRLDVDGEKITGEEDFLSGFLRGSNAWARPVDVVFGSNGELYLSDDKSGNIFKIVRNLP